MLNQDDTFYYCPKCKKIFPEQVLRCPVCNNVAEADDKAYMNDLLNKGYTKYRGSSSSGTSSYTSFRKPVQSRPVKEKETYQNVANEFKKQTGNQDTYIPGIFEKYRDDRKPAQTQNTTPVKKKVSSTSLADEFSQQSSPRRPASSGSGNLFDKYKNNTTAESGKGNPRVPVQTGGSGVKDELTGQGHAPIQKHHGEGRRRGPRFNWDLSARDILRVLTVIGVIAVIVVIILNWGVIAAAFASLFSNLITYGIILAIVIYIMRLLIRGR